MIKIIEIVSFYRLHTELQRKEIIGWFYTYVYYIHTTKENVAFLLQICLTHPSI